MSDLQSVPYLKPGDLIISETGSVLRTTVGSCISVCLYDSVHGIGGMNHFMFAETTEHSNDNRFGNVAIPNLIDGMLKKGASIKNLKASLVGGASSFSSLNKLSAGQKNIDIAESILSQKGIPVFLREIGGCYGRKVLFYTHSNKLEYSLLENCMGHCDKKYGSCQYRIISP